MYMNILFNFIFYFFLMDYCRIIIFISKFFLNKIMK